MNLNGDGGRIQLLISVPIILTASVIAWLAWDPESGFNWVGVLFVIALVWSSIRLLNVTIVEHSPDALRIQRRGREYTIPYSDVLSVSESGRFQGGQAIVGSNHSRYVTVTLRSKYPFGRTFSFYTKKEYGDFEGRSGPAKLIENYAAKARNNKANKPEQDDPLQRPSRRPV
ncbi:hypothetical protein [Haloferula sp. A504]|uniref:hypothetical protein n=1 Tax=Haloferula sp. A504 TaxID=3373601 RepID=UPI0031BD5443|nr:hypothetical protein [Verrucomicrobiaceae bacterium E54]